MPDESPNWIEIWGAKEPWATAALALGLLAAGSIQALLGALYPRPSFAALYAIGGHSAPALWQGEWFRVPLGTLLHVDLLHLLANLSFLMALGPFVERRLGAARLMVVLATAGFFGGLFAVMGKPHHVGIGASSLGTGLFGSLAVICWRLREVLPDWVKASVFALVGGAFVMAQFMVFTNPEIGVQAHVAGFLGGALATVWLERVPDGVEGRAPRWLAVFAGALVGLYVVSPLAAWWHLASGRSCSVLERAGWDEEHAAELRRELVRFGAPCDRSEPRGAAEVSR